VFHEIAGAILGPSRYRTDARKASARIFRSSSRPIGRPGHEGLGPRRLLEVSVPAACRPRSPREGSCAVARPWQIRSRVQAGEVAREHGELSGQHSRRPVRACAIRAP
jgi:hypothetical protein